MPIVGDGSGVACNGLTKTMLCHAPILAGSGIFCKFYLGAMYIPKKTAAEYLPLVMHALPMWL